ncbi:hypothetical protein AS592_09820 [Sulfurovum riftiae]|uniref:OmpA-like domain-containing protein n=2 Tax=Sulfurovum riftiae TaxID=1630136 RepID=A0A151CJG0_9BACT|nr:hypothetical protein AS592_09820 [Sulfurovum riftiae]
MMKQTLWATAALALLLLSGCGQTAPTLGGSGGKNNFTDATEITGDTVTVNESGAGGSLGNSSADGFRSVYFDFGDYGISGAMQDKVSANAARAAQSSGKIKIEGNCDEFGTDEYNYALGLKRAKAVKDAMAAEGVDTGRMVIVSYGESNPVCSSPTDSCYARNRRVDLRLAR